ncbi:histidine--tRNA ligase [Cohnella xylanilytica]|uniref:Histidine--tRNA ligase n=1 Tax=Cohnella xylanilytica TaxID=557555 RepID=A0A841TZW4_9BACL|nr:histidine--tRNA ligase [Cohnella xylanilytica]MBB6691441.1 histidine--tRNA ligase [Cohnella xylanilytica]
MQNVKGTFDFFGEEQALRGRVQAVLREVFELYAFTGMETAILNELTLLTSKYAGGDEILKEMYKLSDQGERRLGLRYDLTIPFAKVVALNPGLQFPFRRYEMGKAFRDGPVKRGRLREFVQCDADVVGIAGPEAEAELLLLAAEAFRRLDVPVRIRWNNRRFLGETLAAVGVPADETASVMLTLDKLEKIGAEGVLAELADKGIEPRTIGRIRELLRAENRPGLMERSPGRFERIADRLDLLTSPGAQEVAALQALLERVGLGEDCVFDPFLSRGLSFYTGTVYEIFGASGDFASSLASGGRYDAMIGKLLGRDDLPFPAAGLSFGMESILAILRDRPAAMPPAAPPVPVIAIGDAVAETLRTAALLRAEGIRATVETGGRKLKKALAAASESGARFAILIGETEKELGQVVLKDMADRTERTVDVEEAIHVLAKALL